MKLLVALPCLNEAKTIENVLRAIPDHIDGISSLTVLVIDDGSEDQTAEVARANGANVIRHHTNLGVGYAFRSAIDYAIENRFDMMVNLDGDGQFDPADISKLVNVILGGEADFVTASRFMPEQAPPKNIPHIKLFGNKLIAGLINRLIKTKFTDVSCGFRAYSKEALLWLNLNGGFTYTQETFLDLSFKRLRIKEIPLKVQYFENRKSRVAGSILKYGLHSGMIILKAYRDYYPLRFFSTASLIMLAPAMVFGGIGFANFLQTGAFTGYFWAVLSAGFLLFMSMLFFVFGLVTDMLDRSRVNQERILYHIKKVRYENTGELDLTLPGEDQAHLRPVPLAGDAQHTPHSGRREKA